MHRDLRASCIRPTKKPNYKYRAGPIINSNVAYIEPLQKTWIHHVFLSRVSMAYRRPLVLCMSWLTSRLAHSTWSDHSLEPNLPRVRA